MFSEAIWHIDHLLLTSSPPCWMTINKRILMSFIVPVIQHGRQSLLLESLGNGFKPPVTYRKLDSRMAAYAGVVLQRFEFIKATALLEKSVILTFCE